MTSDAVANIVRSVLVARGLPFQLLTVGASPTPLGWEVRLRNDHARNIISVIVPDRPIAVRAAIESRLEDEL